MGIIGWGSTLFVSSILIAYILAKYTKNRIWTNNKNTSKVSEAYGLPLGS